MHSHFLFFFPYRGLGLILYPIHYQNIKLFNAFFDIEKLTFYFIYLMEDDSNQCETWNECQLSKRQCKKKFRFEIIRLVTFKKKGINIENILFKHFPLFFITKYGFYLADQEERKFICSECRIENFEVDLLEKIKRILKKNNNLILLLLQINEMLNRLHTKTCTYRKLMEDYFEISLMQEETFIKGISHAKFYFPSFDRRIVLRILKFQRKLIK